MKNTEPYECAEVYILKNRPPHPLTEKIFKTWKKKEDKRKDEEKIKVKKEKNVHKGQKITARNVKAE
jgi:hypothetical protein